MISQIILNLGYRDETYVLSNGHETFQKYYHQMIMKHMNTPMALLNFCLHIKLHVTSTTLKLGYLGKTYVVSWEIATFHVTGVIQSL